MTRDEGDPIAAAYEPNYRRLVEIKKGFDPENVFHWNQNIRPDGIRPNRNGPKTSADVR